MLLLSSDLWTAYRLAKAVLSFGAPREMLIVTRTTPTDEMDIDEASRPVRNVFDVLSERIHHPIRRLWLRALASLTRILPTVTSPSSPVETMHALAETSERLIASQPPQVRRSGRITAPIGSSAGYEASNRKGQHIYQFVQFFTAEDQVDASSTFESKAKAHYASGAPTFNFHIAYIAIMRRIFKTLNDLLLSLSDAKLSIDSNNTTLLEAYAGVRKVVNDYKQLISILFTTDEQSLSILEAQHLATALAAAVVNLFIDLPHEASHSTQLRSRTGPYEQRECMDSVGSLIRALRRAQTWQECEVLVGLSATTQTMSQTHFCVREMLRYALDAYKAILRMSTGAERRVASLKHAEQIVHTILQNAYSQIPLQFFKVPLEGEEFYCPLDVRFSVCLGI